MTLDSEEHRAFLLELVKQANIPGAFIDLAYQVKRAVESADVKTEKKK